MTALRVPMLFVRGNAERALLEPSEEPTERERWLLKRHANDALSFLQTFVAQARMTIEGLGAVRFWHGSPRSDEELVTPATPEERVLAMTVETSEDVVLTAHTHTYSSTGAWQASGS